MTLMRSLELVCVVVGVFFIFVASVGLLRLPDLYSRLHAPTKAMTLGLFFLLAAVALAIPEAVVVTKALLALAFIGATAPIGAHILSRAAYRNGVPVTRLTELNEYDPVVRQRKQDPSVIEPEHAPDLDLDARQAAP